MLFLFKSTETIHIEVISFIILNCMSSVNKFNEESHFSLIQFKKKRRFDGRKIILLLNLDIMWMIFIIMCLWNNYKCIREYIFVRVDRWLICITNEMMINVVKFPIFLLKLWVRICSAYMLRQSVKWFPWRNLEPSILLIRCLLKYYPFRFNNLKLLDEISEKVQ